MEAPKKIWVDFVDWPDSPPFICSIKPDVHSWNGEPYIRADLVDELVGALEPFSMLLKEHHRDMPDNQPIYGINDSLVTAGDLRNARAALAKIKEEKK